MRRQPGSHPADIGSVLLNYARSLMEMIVPTVLPNASCTDPCKKVAGAMQGLHVELCLGLQLDEPHRRPGRRLGDRLRIPIVVLLRLDIGPDIFW